MSIDRECAQRVLKHLQGTKSVLTGAFPELLSTLTVLNNIAAAYRDNGTILPGLDHERETGLLEVLSNKTQEKSLITLFRQCQFVAMDLDMLATVAHKLGWQKDQCDKEELSSVDWSAYAGNDVYLFHLVIRSLMDHIARIICCYANKPYDELSFNKIYSRCISGTLRLPVDEDMRSFITSCTWFSDLKESRDRFIHGFYLDKAVSFAVTEGRIGIVILKHLRTGGHQPWNLDNELMINGNVIDFELYGGLLMAQVIDFLQSLALLVFDKAWGEKKAWLASWKQKGALLGARWGAACRWIERVGHG